MYYPIVPEIAALVKRHCHTAGTQAKQAAGQKQPLPPAGGIVLVDWAHPGHQA